MTDTPRPLTPADLDALEAALKASTQGTWTSGISNDGVVYCRMDDAHEVGWDIEGTCSECFGNIEFIALAHNLMSSLIAEVRRLRAAVDAQPRIVTDALGVSTATKMDVADVLADFDQIAADPDIQREVAAIRAGEPGTFRLGFTILPSMPFEWTRRPSPPDVSDFLDFEAQE